MNKHGYENKYNLCREIRTALIAGVTLMLLLCAIYPLAVWGLSQAIFPWHARGSLILSGLSGPSDGSGSKAAGTPIGSALLGQVFQSPQYFHSRPSNAGSGYDATSSGGSNLGETSKTLMDSIQARVNRYRSENGLAAETPIPADAVTSSASGLDPEISPDNALLQAPRVAKARGLDSAEVSRMVQAHVRGRDLGFLGDPGVNVLLLNLDLDKRNRK